MSDKIIHLRGRLFITFDLKAETGLHIGGSDSGIEIGGVDKTVIRDPLTNRPYVPGSSLKGKMRSLLEKYHAKPQNQRIGQGFIHSCQTNEEYATCDICQVFGVPGERNFGTPTRLVVRDVHMSKESAEALEKANTDLPYTEVKTEVSIDRVTSAANPRQMERVPAGTVFSRAELVYSIYDGAGCDAQKDVQRLRVLAEGLQLLEDDYLGGQGSRGAGKIAIQNIKVAWRGGASYIGEAEMLGEYGDLGAFVQDLDKVIQTISAKLNV